MTSKLTLKEKNLTAIGIVKEGWKLVYGLKLPVFLLTTVQFIALPIILITFALLKVMPSTHHATASNLIITVVIYLSLNAIVWFFVAMLIMLGVRKAIGLPVKIRRVYKECRKAARGIFTLFIIIIGLQVVAYFIQTTIGKIPLLGSLINLAYALFSLYINLVFCIFSLPLIVTRPRMTIEEAITDGLQKMNANWWIIIKVAALTAIIAIISVVLTFGVGLIWTLPLICASYGICFREAYGLKKKPSREG